MKKHGGAIVFVVILMVVGFFFFKDELHIDIKNPFAGKSEVSDSVVEEMLAETTDSIGYSADEATYTWETKPLKGRRPISITRKMTLGVLTDPAIMRSWMYNGTWRNCWMERRIQVHTMTEVVTR